MLSVPQLKGLHLQFTMEIVFPFLICKISHEDFKIGIVKNDLFNSDSF